MARRRIFKIILLGDQGVGKATFRMRFLGHGFGKSYGGIIGANFAVKKAYNYLGEEIIAQIWELTPQNQFKYIRERYYKGSTGGILVFDISRRETFENLYHWIMEFKKYNEEMYVPLFIVGSKSDLRKNSDEAVSRREGEEFAEMISRKIDFKVPYIETSIANSEEIEHGFRQFIDNVTNYLVYTYDEAEEEIKKFMKIHGKSLKPKILQFKKESTKTSFHDFTTKIDSNLKVKLDALAETVGVNKDILLNKIISDFFEK